MNFPNIQVGSWGTSCQSLLQTLQAHTAFFCCTCLANMNLNELNSTLSLSLHQGARHCWRKVTQTDKLVPPRTQDAPVCWQSCCASLIHLLSYSLKKLSKYFLSLSTSNMSHLSLIDFPSYFRETPDKTCLISCHQIYTTTFICPSFPLLLIQWSVYSLFQNGLFFILL